MVSLSKQEAPLRAVLVDDSATVRIVLRRMLEGAGVSVVGVAGDGLEAIELIRKLRPDVVTLDVEMPRLDGLATLERLMAEQPVPVVMVSSLTVEGATATIRALELGAVDFIEKPALSALSSGGIAEIVERLTHASRARIRGGRPRSITPVAPAASDPARAWQRRVVVIGSSTGGPQSLKEVLTRLPADFGAPVAIVQHMPPGFTKSLAERLNSLGPLPCVEAEPGMRLEPGKVLLAPGGHHLEFDARGNVCLTDRPPELGVRPAVNITLESVAAMPQSNPLVAILTGMGHDGVRGCELVRAVGATVIAQDEASSIVYGMPRAVATAGLVDEVVPLDRVADALVRHAQRPGIPTPRDRRTSRG